MVLVRQLFWLLPAAVNVVAQADLPNLSTATLATALPTSSETSSGATTGTTTGATSSETGASTSAATSETSSGTATLTTSNPATTVGGLLTGLPTIAGAGIPQLFIPYTADAPFMQKSNLPEGTVFIAVGAALAFLGSCVLLWRGLVAWSINRSVKRTTAASLRSGVEKSSAWGGSTKNAYYKEYEGGSSMSLDALTSAGKPIRSRPSEDRRNFTAPPAGLFFSPTAQASNRASSAAMSLDGHRNSGYMPAGYYAAPSAADPAGGRSSIALGHSLSPYARHSTVDPSPPGTAGSGLPNSRSTSNYYGGTPGVDSRAGLRTHDTLSRASRENLRASSREGYRLPSRDGYGSRPSSHVYPRQTSSPLQTGLRYPVPRVSSEHLAGQRAPSAVLDEMFENHGHVPRERS